MSLNPPLRPEAYCPLLLRLDSVKYSIFPSHSNREVLGVKLPLVQSSNRECLLIMVS